MATTDKMAYMGRLDTVVREAVALIRLKTQTYSDSWKKRGGTGAWFTIVRPWDRLEGIVARHGGDIFAAIEADPTGQDGSALACVRDLMNYMILVEAHARAELGVPDAPRSFMPDQRGPGTPDDGGHHASPAALQDAGDPSSGRAALRPLRDYKELGDALGRLPGEICILAASMGIRGISVDVLPMRSRTLEMEIRIGDLGDLTAVTHQNQEANESQRIQAWLTAHGYTITHQRTGPVNHANLPWVVKALAGAMNGA